MSAANYSRRSLVAYAILSFALVAITLYAWLTFEGIPARSSLAEATGKVEWSRSGKYDVKFKLLSSPLHFTYLSKGNAMDLVETALTRSDGPVITILYDPAHPGGPVYSDTEYYDVYEVLANRELVRAYPDVAEAWASDTALAPWLAGIFAAIGTFMLFLAARSAT